MLDRLTSMQIFVEAVNRGSLSAAGRALKLSPAMAAKYLDALEERLGLKLLHRSTRQLRLTDVGADYLNSCRQILQQVAEADAEVTALSSEAIGLLRMNVPLSFGNHYIAPLLPAFSQRYPLVEIELGLSDQQQDILADGWDLALRIGRLSDSNFKSRSLGNCPMRLCAAPEYLQRYGTPQQSSDLAQHNCLSYTLSAMQRNGQWAFGRDGEYKVTVRGNLQANSGDALLVAAIGGQGVIYQPDFIVRHALTTGQLREITLHQPNIDLGGLHLLFHPSRSQPAKVRAMIDFLVEKFN
ncbi:LysR family transcriptional regulator [Rheinheimera sp. MMS21-TC3]|uniref:LysR family transcriptional regulator n=1 Tax=Rheinheimera sp. MMS21-TC3 TaxID=3072790 RepID=UPI0028C4D9C3|nr:LysR family transcriptional regulator [Rheinheimera sp. MMS21-TC3]WNO60639.1 LysR family transcriptional regulator [Rheinheimera sp. MMS21-TC3]